VDDAYLGGELVAARPVEFREQSAICGSHFAQCRRRPLYIKMAPVPSFTRKAIVDWANEDLSLGCVVTSDGLGCFAGVTDAAATSGHHRWWRKPKDLPEFNWITRFG